MVDLSSSLLDSLPEGNPYIYNPCNYGKSPFIIGKSTIQIIFNSYVKLPEGREKREFRECEDGTSEYASPSHTIPGLDMAIMSMAISGSHSLEVPTIYKAYVREYTPKNPQNMAWKMVQYLHFRILEFPLIMTNNISSMSRSHQ